MDSVLRAAAIYVILLVITRLSGRRALAQATPFDFVLLLIVAETVQEALLGDEDMSLTHAVILIVTLFALDILLSFLKQSSPRVALWLDGTPTVLISAGHIDARALRRARVDLEDVLEAARLQHGLKRLDQVEAAVLEVSGEISIVPKPG